MSQTTPPGYSSKAAERYTQDVDKAEALLDEAGWTEGADGVREKDGKPLKVVLPYSAGSIINADGASILQGVQEQAEKVASTSSSSRFRRPRPSRVRTASPKSATSTPGYWTAVTSGILQINYGAGVDGAANYWNAQFTDYPPELQEIILQANSEADVDAQNALYAKAQDYIAEHALSIGVYDRLSTLAVSPKLAGVWQEHAQGGPTFYDAHFTE